MSIHAFNATRLSTERVAKGWTRGELAALVWVTAQDIFWWETGQTMPAQRQAMRLASALGIDLADLYFGVDPTTIPV
jgi:ribosome-binding protein aMBF1 (putative translation factor)